MHGNTFSVRLFTHSYFVTVDFFNPTAFHSLFFLPSFNDRWIGVGHDPAAALPALSLSFFLSCPLFNKFEIKKSKCDNNTINATARQGG